MKNADSIRFLLIALCCLWAASARGQSSCFDQCWTQFHKSRKPSVNSNDPVVLEMIEENHRILQGLVGCKVPSFVVETLDGKEFSMEKFRGKIVVLSFWFTTCEQCVYELPGLNKLVKEFSDKNVSFLALARNDREEVIRFKLKHEYNYAHALSSEELHRKYCLMGGWPMNMVIDGEGILRYVKSGGPIPPDGNPLQPYLEMKPVLEKYVR